jgi:hypothetical protein
VLDIDSVGSGLRDQAEKISLFFILHAEAGMIGFRDIAAHLAEISGPALSRVGVVRKIHAKRGDSLAINQQIVRADIVVASSKSG